MKKIAILMAVVFVFCGCTVEKEEIKTGVYKLMAEESKEGVFTPYVSIDEKEDTFIFFFDGLSSYMNTGEYVVEGEKLICETNDGKYRYVFEIKEDILIFDEELSSEVELIDEKFCVKITDGAEFKME